MSLMAMMTGIIMAIAVYLLMSPQLVRWLYGLILFSSAINLCIFIAGRVYFSQPAFINGHAQFKMANPLPQAMVLTAIVIFFALIAFALIVLRQLYKKTLSMEDELAADEPELRKNRTHYG